MHPGDRRRGRREIRIGDPAFMRWTQNGYRVSRTFPGRASSGSDKERLCAIRTILKKIYRSTKPADW